MRDKSNKYRVHGPFYDEFKKKEKYVIGIITGGYDFPEQYKGIMEVILRTLTDNRLFFFIPSEHVGSEPTYEEIQWEGIFETYLYYFSKESVEYYKEKYLPVVKKYVDKNLFTPLYMWVTTNDVKAEPFTNLNSNFAQYMKDNPIPIKRMKIYYYMKADKDNNLVPRELLTDHYLPYLPHLPYLEQDKYIGEYKHIIDNFSHAVVDYDKPFQWCFETLTSERCEPGGTGKPNFDCVVSNIVTDPKVITALDLGYGIFFDFVAKYAYKPVNVTEIDYDAETFLQIVEEGKKYMKEINDLHFEATNYFDQYKKETEYIDKIKKEAERIRKRDWPKCNYDKVDCDINPNFSEDLSKVRDTAKKNLELKKTLKK